MSDDKLDLILNELRSVKSDINSINAEMSSMKSNIHSMQSDMESMQTEMGSVKSEMGSVKSELGSMKSDINIIKSQLDENTKLTKAIYHRQEEFEAKFQGDITAINKKLSQTVAEQKAICRMLGEHEIAIRTIRNPI